MAKTLKPSGKMTREEYLLNIGKALYGQSSGVNPLGISSSSKQMRGGDTIEGQKEIDENQAKGSRVETEVRSKGCQDG